MPAFRQQLDDWITHTLAQKYNGKSAPRIVLFSPIAHEDLHNPGPAGRPREQRAAGALHEGDGGGRRGARRAVRRSVHAEPRSCTRAAKTPLTINGVHLNAEGNRRIGEVIDRALFGPPPAHKRRPTSTALRQAVAGQELHWFNRYRTTDGFATFGDRAFLTFIRGNPRDVNPEQVQFEPKKTCCRPTTRCWSARSPCSTC